MRKREKELFEAVDAGQLDRIKYLVLEKGVNVNTNTTQGITPIMVAARINAVPVVRLLIGLGADANKKDYIGRNATNYALKYGAEAVLIELFNLESDISDAV